MTEAARGAKGERGLRLEPAHQHDALRELLDARYFLDAGLQRRRRQALDRSREILEGCVRVKRA